MGCCSSKQSVIQGIGRTERLPRDLTPATERDSSKKVQEKTSSDQPSKDTSPPTLHAKKRDNVGSKLTQEELALRRVSSIKTTKLNLGDQGELNVRYAYCSQRGYYPNDLMKPNQDAVSICKKFAQIDGDLFVAVLDGHGPKGEEFALYGKKHLPSILSKCIRQERAAQHKIRNDKATSPEEVLPFNPKLWPMLNQTQYEKVCKKAHLNVNAEMLSMQPSVKLSGTTSISAAFHDGRMTISNVGDSRAVLGVKDPFSKKLKSKPLSKDQTPWRQDERERVMEAGARVLTVDQIHGFQSKNNVDFGDRILGDNDDVDIAGDPPRCWLQNKSVPGTSFTRSLGDSIAQTIGITAEPEMCTKDISREDRILVLASDGVFEFLPNQTVIDICAQCDDPLEASKRLVHTSHEKWLEFEDRTDDITAIVMFFDSPR